jgi:hypothetical protein
VLIMKREFPKLEKGCVRNRKVRQGCFSFLPAVNLIMEEANEDSKAARSGNPNVLRYALDQQDPGDWDHVMREAAGSGSLDCVKVLYDKGYEQHRSTKPNLHPAVFAVNHGRLEILRFVVDVSGPPQAEELYGECAVKGGVEMLMYAREFGCVFNERMTETAAGRGDLEALRYLHMNGAPWDSRTVVAALLADSLPCLEYAHMHGCPHEEKEWWSCHEILACSLPVLRYVWKHLDPALAERMDLWDTMARVPRELQELIAVKAELIVL